MERFSKLFDESLVEFKKGFRLFFPLILLFSILPGIILSLVSVYYTNFLPENINAGILMIFLTIAFLLLEMLVYISIIYYSFANKKNMSLGGAIRGGKGFFIRYVLTALLITVVLVGIVILLLPFIALFYLNEVLVLVGVLGILTLICFFAYVAVKWSLSYWIIVDENIGVTESLTRSSQLVKGRWWKVFGNFLLLGLIFIGIIVVINLPALLLSYNLLPPGSSYLDLEKEMITYPLNTQIWLTLISSITDGIVGLIITPLGILFTKNLYLSIKKKSVKRKKKA